jgi:uncharacterized protein (DUF1697 family)
MPRYVALLGSINVGGNRLKMADLRAALERHGFADVETVVASGNVLFEDERADDATLAKEVAKVVEEAFGIAAFVAVRTKGELAATLAESPFAGVGEDKFVHVQFLGRQPTASQFAALADDNRGRGNEKLAPGTRALHIDFVDGVAGSKLTAAFIEKRLGSPGTARNVRSIQRIIEKFD